MRNALLILLLLLLNDNLSAQMPVMDSTLRGFGDFILGDPQSKFQAMLKPIRWQDTSNSKRAPYAYAYAGVKPDTFTDSLLDFQCFTPWFGTDHTLTQLHFIIFYDERDGYPSPKQFKKDYKKLLHYLAGKWHNPGKKTRPSDTKNSVWEWHEWENEYATFRVDAQYRGRYRRPSLSIFLIKKTQAEN